MPGLLAAGFAAALAGVSLSAQLGPPRNDVMHLWADVPLGSGGWNLTTALRHAGQGGGADGVHRRWLSDAHMAKRIAQNNWRDAEHLDPKFQGYGPIALVINLQKLRDGDHDQKTAAARVLGELACTLAEGKAKAVAALRKALSDKGVRVDAAMALGEIFSQTSDNPTAFANVAAEAVEALTKALSDDNGSVRSDAAMALAYIFRHTSDISTAFANVAAEAVEALTKALCDDSKSARGHAALALGVIFRHTSDNSTAFANAAAGAVEALTKALSDDYESARGHAAMALGAIFRHTSDNSTAFANVAAEAVAALRKALSDDSEFVKRHAFGALKRRSFRLRRVL